MLSSIGKKIPTTSCISITFPPEQILMKIMVTGQFKNMRPELQFFTLLAPPPRFTHHFSSFPQLSEVLLQGFTPRQQTLPTLEFTFCCPLLNHFNPLCQLQLHQGSTPPLLDPSAAGLVAADSDSNTLSIAVFFFLFCIRESEAECAKTMVDAWRRCFL